MNLGILEIEETKKTGKEEPSKSNGQLREHRIDVFVCSVGDKMLW